MPAHAHATLTTAKIRYGDSSDFIGTPLRCEDLEDCFDVRLIDFHCNRTHDEINGKHEAELVFSPDQYALSSSEGAGPDPHAMANLQVRMRLRADSAG